MDTNIGFLKQVAQGRQFLLEAQRDEKFRNMKIIPACENFILRLRMFGTDLRLMHEGRAVYNFDTHSFEVINHDFHKAGSCESEDKKITKDSIVTLIHQLAHDIFEDESKEKLAEKYLLFKFFGNENKYFFGEEDFEKANQHAKARENYLNNAFDLAEKLKQDRLKDDQERIDAGKLPSRFKYEVQYLEKQKKIKESQLKHLKAKLKDSDQLLNNIQEEKKKALDIVLGIPEHSTRVKTKKEKLIQALNSLEKGLKSIDADPDDQENKDLPKTLNLPSGQEIAKAIQSLNRAISAYESDLETNQQIKRHEKEIEGYDLKIKQLREKALSPEPKKSEQEQEIEAEEQIKPEKKTKSEEQKETEPEKTEIKAEVTEAKKVPTLEKTKESKVSSNKTNPSQKKTFGEKFAQFFANIFKGILNFFKWIFKPKK